MKKQPGNPQNAFASENFHACFQDGYAAKRESRKPAESPSYGILLPGGYARASRSIRKT
jgi:hypothetical protein